MPAFSLTDRTWLHAKEPNAFKPDRFQRPHLVCWPVCKVKLERRLIPERRLMPESPTQLFANPPSTSTRQLRLSGYGINPIPLGLQTGNSQRQNLSGNTSGVSPPEPPSFPVERSLPRQAPLGARLSGQKGRERLALSDRKADWLPSG